MIICSVFLPHLFSLETSNYLILNRKTIFQLCLLQVQYFSQLHYVNTRSAKLESQFYHFPSSKLCILQDINYFESTYLAQFNSIEKYNKQYISYFYQMLHFKMNPTKFGSPHLDTPSSRYNFCKLATKSMKNK